jgi:N-methylhydantoinase A
LKSIVQSSTVCDTVTLKAKAGVLQVFQGTKTESKYFGLSKKKITPLRVIDEDGIVRLQLTSGEVRSSTIGMVSGSVRQLLDEFTMYGDAGGLIPDIFLVTAGRIIDLTGLVMKDQIVSMAQAETEKIDKSEIVVIIGAKKK